MQDYIMHQFIPGNPPSAGEERGQHLEGEMRDYSSTDL